MVKKINKNNLKDNPAVAQMTGLPADGSAQTESNMTEMERMMTERPMSSGVLGFVLEMIKVTLIALAIILPTRQLLVKPFYVNGASMEPNYHNNEYLIIDEISYRLKSGPQRGQVIVFKYPRDKKQFFIKRVIGLPGERVAVKDGQVTIYNDVYQKGIVIKEPYLSADIITPGESDVTLRADEYFVLGDNRAASLDSRRFGPVKEEDIIGKTWLRGWPFDKAGVLEHYDFNF